MKDLERKLRALGDRANEEVLFSGRLPAAAPRRIRLRRAGVVGAVVVVIGALVSGAVLAASAFFPRPAPVVAPSSTWTLYQQPHDGWSARYPSSWHAQPLRTRDTLEFVFRGAIVSNVEHEFSFAHCGRRCFSSEVDMKDLPADLVAVRFGYSVGGLGNFPTPKPDTSFPLHLASLRSPIDRPSYGAPQPRLTRHVRLAGTSDFLLDVWIGPAATPAARSAVRRIVASITKPKPPVCGARMSTGREPHAGNHGTPVTGHPALLTVCKYAGASGGRRFLRSATAVDDRTIGSVMQTINHSPKVLPNALLACAALRGMSSAYALDFAYPSRETKVKASSAGCRIVGNSRFAVLGRDALFESLERILHRRP